MYWLLGSYLLWAHIVAHRPVPRAQPPAADSTRRSFALRVVDELIHHTAEVALLRDIWAATGPSVPRPKLTIFFFAFLPQFVPAHAPHQVATMLLLGGVFMLMTLIVFTIYGVSAALVRRHLIDRPRIVRRLRQAFAASFIALSAKLVTTARQ
jgi:threonine/homoserine/homoserine lactone efflux protein